MIRNTRSPETSASAPPSRRPESPRQITSAHIDAHLAAFEAAGGKVEVLATTTVLKRIQIEPEAKLPAA